MNAKEIQQQILSRYEKEGRKFPWRETRNPYAIHICEVMSQQTQLGRVLPYWQQRIQDIPDYETLSNISKVELLKHWSGLGFNSRALRLQECARAIMEYYNGEPPHSKAELLKLPGIGPYTASAICAFARNMDEAVIDTNIRRVLIFLLKLPEDISMKELEKQAKKLIPPGRSRDWHNALMDYGAIYLTAKKTNIKSVGKQSKFEGSNREVRGWIVKQLVNNEQRRDGSGTRPPTSYSITIQHIKSEFPHKEVEKIVQGLIDEGIVKMKKGEISIVN